jgi:pyruvate formate lyase activating enzyme
MSIKGFQGTSLLDFPQRIAALVFWGGCNLTCPFCHNPALVLDPSSLPDLPMDIILDKLSQRRSFIDGVVITGGEPTLDEALPDFLQAVKALGLQVKLDTNGLMPQVIQNLVNQSLVDYLAVDLKTLPQRYRALHSGAVRPEALLETVSFCAATSVTVEFRTTCVPGWVDEQVITGLGSLIEGAPLWALQQYQPHHALCPTVQEVQPYSHEKLHALASLARNYVKDVRVRGL